MLKRLFASCLSLVVLIVIVVFAGAYLMVREDVPDIEDGSYLVFDMAGFYPEDAQIDLWTQIFEGEPLTVYDMLKCIRMAGYDDRIDGILLRINILGTGYGKVQEIRGALEQFKESGKKVISYIEIGRDLEYYLATAADEIYMAPVSMIMVDGIVGNAMFVRGTFDILGVTPNFVRIGDYKTAVDLFTSREMSDAQRWMISSLIDSIFSRYVADVSEARGIDPERVKEIIDNGLFDSRQALEEGLVDDLLYDNQLEGKLKGEAEEFHGVNAETYREIDPASIGLTGDVKFALIVADGSINLGGSGESVDFGKIAGSSTLSKAIGSALEDDEIEAIILRVNSPGGMWVAADMVWGEIVKAMEEKPVVVSMSDQAASGGYYIAMPADAIIAEPSTLTGSIGVYIGKFNISGLYSKVGLKKESIARGKNAEAFSEMRDFSEDDRSRIYANLWEFYINDFVGKASDGRGILPDSVDNMGRGRVWTGEQALELGLVDELGGLWDAVEKAKEFAEIPAEKEVSLVLMPEPKALFQRILEGNFVLGRPSVELPWQAEEIASSLHWLNLMGSQQVVAIMPYMIEFE
jgi:protease-4